jgi:hypothetical protein
MLNAPPQGQRRILRNIGRRFQRQILHPLSGRLVEKGTSKLAPTTSPLSKIKIPDRDRKLGENWRPIAAYKTIIGIFDEESWACTTRSSPTIAALDRRLPGNASVIPALYYETTVSDFEAARLARLESRHEFLSSAREEDPLNGGRFSPVQGDIAAALADDFGCKPGIQSAGLKISARIQSEGMLKPERPPVKTWAEIITTASPSCTSAKWMNARPDGLITNRHALQPARRKHLRDLRCGISISSSAIRLGLLISGSARRAYFIDGCGASGEPHVFQTRRGGTSKWKPGEIVWSPSYADGSEMDLDQAVVRPEHWAHPHWPIAHAVTYGVSHER